MVYNDAPWLDHGQEHRFVHPKLSHEVSTGTNVHRAWDPSPHAAQGQALQCRQPGCASLAHQQRQWTCMQLPATPLATCVCMTGDAGACRLQSGWA